MRLAVIGGLAALAVAVAPARAASFGTPPRPTFACSFDHGLTPDICVPGTVVQVDGPVSFVDGRVGRGLFVPRGARLSFPSAGHLFPAAGTIALWALTSKDARRPPFARLFDCSGGAVALRLMHPPNPDVPFNAEATIGGRQWVPWPLGDGQAVGEIWQHLALTWGPGGVAFYENGVTLCADAAMPPPAWLPERFFLGSEETGRQSAGTAIDEVELFDRALTSHELFALAGRQSPTDLSLGNLLANSSFEVGPQPWSTAFWEDRGSTAGVDQTAAHSGQCAMHVDRRANLDPFWSTVWLMGPWLHLQRDLLVTLSAWLAADGPDVEVALDIQGGTQSRAVRGAADNGLVRRSFRIGNKWQRCVLSATLPLAYKDGYRPRVSVTSHPCQVWIDDVQLAVGSERSYVPKDAVEIGLVSDSGSALREPRATMRPLLRCYAADGCDKPVMISWGYRRPAPHRGYVAADQAFFVGLRPGEPQEAALKAQRLDVNGVWQVEAAQYGRSAARLLLAVAPTRWLDAPVVTSPFGIHGGESDAMLRLGLPQRRDVSGFLWKWLERTPGAFQDSGRFEEAAQAHADGLRLCATLGEAPEWAGKGGVPDDLKAWQAYVRRTVAANREAVEWWEVWNEPDLNPVFAAAPQRYADLLAATRAAAPDVKLVGLCPSSIEAHSFAWAEQVMAGGALKNVDAVSWHPYCHEPPEGPFVAGLQRINDLMEQHGGRKPLLLTEYGTAGLSDPSLQIPWDADGWRRWDPEEQAALLVRQSVLALWQGASRLYWYKWTEENLQSGPDTFGLLTADTYRTPKPALLALSHMARLLQRAELPPLRLRRPGTQQALRFYGPDGDMAVVWDPLGPSEIRWPRGWSAEDLYGNPVWRRPWQAMPEPLWLVRDEN